MKSGVYFDCYYPSFCANCGKEISEFIDKDDIFDWKNKATYTCDCGTKYVRVVEDEDLAEETVSDLEMYRERGI